MAGCMGKYDVVLGTRLRIMPWSHTCCCTLQVDISMHIVNLESTESGDECDQWT